MRAELYDQDWENQIRNKLAEVFDSESNSQDLVEVLLFLDQELKACSKSAEGASGSENAPCYKAAPTWSILSSTLCFENVFRRFAKKLAEDLKKANELKSAEDWEHQVRQKLRGLFHSEAKDVATILNYLDKEKKAYDNSAEAAPTWRVLKLALLSAEDFRRWSTKLLEDIRKGEELKAVQHWKEQVRIKLAVVFDSESEDLVKLRRHLDEEDKTAPDSIEDGLWSALVEGLSSEDLFRKNLEKVMEVVKRREEENSWKDLVRKKLGEVFHSESETENLVRVLHYLDVEDSEYVNSGIPGPTWRTLKRVLASPDVFRRYAESLAEDTSRGEKDQTFRETMKAIWSNMLKSPDMMSDENGLARWNDFGSGKYQNVLRGLAMAPAVVKQQARLFLRSQMSYGTIQCFRVVVPTAFVSLASVVLAPIAIVELWRWWKGEISGLRCASNLVSATLSLGAGVALGVATGLAMGLLPTIFGPISIAVGGACGAFLGAKLGDMCGEYIREKIFDLPRDEALENSYRYFGVHRKAKNAEINLAFRKMCLKHHPDKGGKLEEFLRVQSHMGVIRAARKAEPQAEESPAELKALRNEYLREPE